MGIKTKLQLKFIKASSRAMPDKKLTELYYLVLNQEDKTEKEYSLVLKIIEAEMNARHLL